jgi:peroxiredoxin
MMRSARVRSGRQGAWDGLPIPSYMAWPRLPLGRTDGQSVVQSLVPLTEVSQRIPAVSMTGVLSLMRSLASPFGVIAVALYLFCGSSALTHGDEPVKPTPSASAANPAVPAPGHSVHGEAFNDGPRRSAVLMPGMGKVHFTATTNKPDAQPFIDQGVAQLHSFYYFEAERSFRQAAKIDPDCAMAYWGMSMANINNPQRARGFLKEAKSRARSITRRETLYLDALEASLGESGAPAARGRKRIEALETLVQEFPGDIDARAWLAMVTWQYAGDGNGIGSRQAVDVVLDTVLQIEPMHPGAHHYRIHLWDGHKPARADKSAALYGKTAPGIAHAWHMPGHTYTGLKRYSDAAYQQEASARVDHAYMIRDRVMPFEIHNYAHNNQWLCTSLSHIGRARDAIAVARNLVEQPRDPQKNGPNDGGSPQRSGRIRWAEVMARYELWDDLIQATSSGAIDWSSISTEQEQKAYFLGQAYAARNDLAKLGDQIDALKKITNAGAKAALAELEGHQLLARGEVGPAFDQFAKATSMRPEALARAQLKARNFGFAESKAREAVTKNPNQVPILAALVEILQACDKEKEAQEAYRSLEPLARCADRDLPVFRRLDTIVAGWHARKSWSLSTAPSPSATTGTDETAINRVDLSPLGPLVWSPFAAKPFSGTDTSGKPWSLADHRGKNVLLIFVLGGKCAHCMQQLQLFGNEFEAFKKQNLEMVAVNTDDVDATKALKNNKEGIKFPMPMLADPKLETFKRYEAYDDFESQPLHATFLIDVRGNVRFQRISADPFLDVEFIKSETQRLNRMTKPQ